ncbi:hypothetical protein MYX77_06960 [Acidobacteriia bacterium AH_259_A11_L15]|nr:hypothetical protein [Acidobacteriia bacterium AH_259_A11_L15]
MTTRKLDAADVLNWEYLCEIAEYRELPEIKNLGQALRAFAYSFTSTASIENQNRMLADWLRNACARTPAEEAEEVVARLAYYLRSDRSLVRQLALENGILREKRKPS